MVNVEQLVGVYVKLANRPGAIANVAKAVADKRISIDGMSAETWGNEGAIRVYTAKPRETLQALRAAGIDAYESEVVVASLPDRPGEIARAASELGAANINIESMTVTVDGRTVFRTSDNARASQILGKL